jgi:lipopolysaccharide assembly outer membrane protein LptD (OstA)
MLAIILVLWCAPTADAQEPIVNNAVRELDISTSSLTELAIWCRNLGLSEGGTKTDLATRLRNYYQLPVPDAGVIAPNQRIVTIESARSSEYFSLEVVQEDYARLRGGVVISLKDGDTTHRISADEVLYNRTRNIMTASGSVEYISEKETKTEVFRGESVTIDMDTWVTVFLGGVSDMSLSGETTTYRFAGTVISHPSASVTVLTDAEISNAANPEALWSVHASKIWLLPGSDFAIANVVLKVGEVPVFYWPFLHWPADTVIFHPVLGYRSREGSFAQTTTYLWGRPTATATAAESSVTKVLQGGSDQEQRREGIFLRSTGRKTTDPNDKRLSILFDVYANLGLYAGAEMVLPKKDQLGAMTLSAGIGVTRDIYQYSTGYTPYDSTGKDTWNTSQFIFGDVPFRYRLNTKGSYTWQYATLQWNIPAYSDPYVDKDFILNRSENMDWFAMLRDGSAGRAIDTTQTSIGSYEWRVNSTINPPITAFNPYITSLSISNLSSFVSFKTRTSLQYGTSSPNYTFFYPDKYTLYSLTASISGTVFNSAQSTSATQAETAGKEEKEEKEKADPLAGLETLILPWDPIQAPGTKPVTPAPDPLAPPALSQSFTLPVSTANAAPRLVIEYRFAPSLASDLQFRTSALHWIEPSDINWSEVSSVLSTFKSDGALNFTISQTEGLNYSTFFRVAQASTVQDYTYINEQAEEYTSGRGETDFAKINAANRLAYSASYFSSSWEFGTSIKPFYQYPLWSATSFQYSAKGLLAKTVFSGTGEEPHWDLESGKWHKDYFDAHRITATMALSIMDKQQTLSLITDIPPKDASIEANATFRIWQTETNLRGKILDPWEERIFDLFYFTETLQFDTAHAGSFRQYFSYDPELETFKNITSTFAWNGIAASFAMTYSKAYTLDTKLGWIVPDGTVEQLNPSTLSLSYSKSFAETWVWQDKLSFSLNINPSLTMDLQRYTNSKFTFALGFTIKLRNFLDISFSSTSENTAVFRYFQDIPLFDLPVELPGEKNLFVDLLNSFRFDDDVLRRSSGFKLKTFNFTLVHHLGDWDASLGIKLSPYRDGTVYKFNNEITFLVQWKPLSEIKSEITSNKDIWTFK